MKFTFRDFSVAAGFWPAHTETDRQVAVRVALRHELQDSQWSSSRQSIAAAACLSR
jgi:hypothetical protein